MSNIIFQIINFLKKLERKFWYIIVLLFLFNGCIFLLEWNEGRIKTKEDEINLFLVQSFVYDKKTQTTKITVLETEPLIKGKSLTSYAVNLKYTPKQLKLKKGAKIKIDNTVKYNNAGKHYRVLNGIYLQGKKYSLNE